MNFYTNISTKTPYDPKQGMAKLQAPAPQFSQNQAVQQNFADNYRPVAQKGAMDLSRQGTMAAADFRQKATQAQNNAVLAGLGTLNTQQRNAMDRNQAMQKMAYGFMGDMMGGFGNVLGGLL